MEILSEAIPEKSAIAFSGGLDSSLIAFLSIKKNAKSTAYVAGMKDSHDILWAKKASGIIGIPLKKIILDEKEIISSAEELSVIIGTNNLVILSFELPLYFVAREAEEGIIITGQGADELFGGYKRYESMSPELLESEMNKDLEDLVSGGIERERSIAAHFGKELCTPYLTPDFISSVMEKDALHRKGTGRKDMLRDIARGAGLASALYNKQKKAAQYGSGIMKVLKKHKKQKEKMV